MTFEEAVDDIQKMLTDAWESTGYPLYYESLDAKRDHENDNPFAISTIRHYSGRQRTLGVTDVVYSRGGSLYVQIFAPTGNGLQESYQLAKVVTDAFEGNSSPNGVWFRAVRINEVGKDGAFFQTNVIVNFAYDEVK